MAAKSKPSVKSKKAKKPSKVQLAKLGNVGMKKAPTDEVSGKMSPGMNYVCWQCAAINYVPFGWTSFYCWNCGALNLV